MILWLTGKSGLPPTTKALLLDALAKQGISSSKIIFNSLLFKSPSLGEYNRSARAKKEAQLPKLIHREAALHALGEDVKLLQPNLIVVNDEPTLRALTAEPYTLFQVRGSVYRFKDIPVLIMEKSANLWNLSYGKWMFGFDLSKLVRYATGKVKYEPAFNFILCNSVNDVRHHCDAALNATLVAEDTETRSGFVTVRSFTYDVAGKLYTCCVPFFDPYKLDGAYWDREEDEVAVHMELARLQASPVYKVYQNGMYDCAYEIEAGMPPTNYLFDTQNMMHALWCEAPKKLHHIASYFVDNYQYWKDEAKGVKEDAFGKSHKDVERYWRYNGLDTYYTWLGCRELVARLVQLEWAVRNYNSTIALGVGPCLAASLRGLNVNQARHGQLMARKMQEAEAGIRDLQELTGEADFNPNSSRDVGWFLYDVLGARTTALQKRKNSKYGPRSTDENVLKLIKEQRSPLVNNFIDRLLEAKKPAADISKYGDLWKLCRNGKFLSWSSPTATVTSRFNSTKGQFWTGTNAQNIPDYMQEIFTSRPGYVYVKFDYGASDDRFIAYEAQDPDKIATVEDKTKDIHCRHAAFFFSKPYDAIYKGYKAREEWVVQSTKGVRQLAKKTTHGRNFGEEAETMYYKLGRDAVVATAIFLGHEKAAGYSDRQLINICAYMIDKYDHPQKGMYKRIRPWKKEVVNACIKNNATATFAGGFTRKFFGDLNKHDTQRELISCYGQSGTAGNTNRSLRSVWYDGVDDGKSCLYLLQIHDALLFEIKTEALHEKVPIIQEIMERSQVIHGREMRVPVAPKVGLTWSEDMLDYKTTLTHADILAFEEKTFGSKYKKDFDFNIAKIFSDLGIGDVDVGDDELLDPEQEVNPVTSSNSGALEGVLR